MHLVLAAVLVDTWTRSSVDTQAHDQHMRKHFQNVIAALLTCVRFEAEGGQLRTDAAGLPDNAAIALRRCLCSGFRTPCKHCNNCDGPSSCVLVVSLKLAVHCAHYAQGLRAGGLVLSLGTQSSCSGSTNTTCSISHADSAAAHACKGAAQKAARNCSEADLPFKYF